MNTMSTGRTPGAPGWEGNGPTQEKKVRNTTPKSNKYAMKLPHMHKRTWKKTMFLMIPRTKQEKTSNPNHHPKLISHQQKKIQSIR